MYRIARPRRTLALALALSLVVSLIVGPVSASAAVTPAASSVFTGGPDQAPTYMLNDHTPVAVHFTATGLTPNAEYYLKVRVTVGTSPSGTTNRGWTWNPLTSMWVQERDAWTSFPQVETDSSGNIGSNAGWTFVKFGDVTQSGTYHIMISLSDTGQSSTFNSSIVPAVTVLDPRVNGSWVHNGRLTNASYAGKNARVTDDASTTVLSLQKAEANGLDDDSNGIVDDEKYSSAGPAGDFRMGVPTGTAISVNLNQSRWAPANGFVSGAADVDLAVASTTDTSAPTAPGTLTGSSGDATASLSWSAASDNTAVAGYYVYRWATILGGQAYSPVHSRIATLGASATSYDDTALTDGTEYNYEVRAFDAATNVGPRSNTLTVAPLAPGSLTGTVTSSLGGNLSGVSVSVGTTITPVTTASDGTYSVPGIIHGTYDVTYSLAGYAPQTVNGVVINGGSVTTQNMALVPLPGTLSGVVHSSAGPALSGVSVTVGSMSSVTTIGDGTYSVPGITPGTYDVSFAKTGYGTFTANGVTIGPAGAVTQNATLTLTPTLMPVWRFYNLRTGTHFYTADAAERDRVSATMGGTYHLDGVAYNVNTANTNNSAPLYRFYNVRTGAHFYTADTAERDRIMNTMGATYHYDGPAYNVCLTNVTGATTVWRFYNKRTGTHFYTADAAEKANVLATLGAIYALDGPAFYLAP
jgi:hypothetical protein